MINSELCSLFTNEFILTGTSHGPPSAAAAAAAATAVQQHFTVSA